MQASRRGAAAVWLLLLRLILVLLLLLLLSTDGGARPRSASASCQRRGLAAVVDGSVHLLFRSVAFFFYFSCCPVATGDGAFERGQGQPHRDHRRGRALEARLAPVASVEGARHERSRAGTDAGIAEKSDCAVDFIPGGARRRMYSVPAAQEPVFGG